MSSETIYSDYLITDVVHDLDNLKSRLIEYRKLNNRSWTSVIKDEDLKKDLDSVSIFKELPLHEKAAALLLGRIPACECGNKVKYEGKIKSGINGTCFGGWLEFCSTSCSKKSSKTIQRRKDTTKARYGADSWAKTEEAKIISSQPWSQEKKDAYNEKNKQTCINRYGTEHYSKTQEFKDRVIETTLLQTDGKYTNHFQNVEKIKDINNKKYGADYFIQTDIGRKLLSENNPMKRFDIALKSKLNRMSNRDYSTDLYEVLVSNDSEKFKSFIHNLATTYSFKHRKEICKHLNISYSYLNRLMRINDMDDEYLNIGTNKSYKELEVYNFVNSLGVNAKFSDRTILNGKEIDILIESHKLGIEFDGLYFHSVFAGGKDKMYHLDKTLLSEEKGYQLLHIFEHEWDDEIKQAIWKSIIKSKLGLIDNKIYARKCTIKNIDSKLARKFFDKNHLSGFIGAENHVGLFYQDELVSALSYGKSRFDQNETELYRFASVLDTTVVGALGKMLSVIPNKENLISFADRRISGIDSVYSKFFKNRKSTSPSWQGFKRGTTLTQHRLSFTKTKVMSLLNDKYDNNLTVLDNLFNSGYDIIYDCGNWKFYN